VNNFLKNITVVLEAADLCLKQRLSLPALILIYSCIDSLGSLERSEKEGTKQSFIRWVDNYLLKAKQLDCTAEELFAARCGVLHALTPDSDLYRQGKVRRIMYASGPAKLESIRRVATIFEHLDVVGIHIDDLRKAVEDGLSQYLRELAEDEIRKKKVEERATKSFGWVPDDVINELLSKRGQE
jgi:hypothetical protein